MLVFSCFFFGEEEETAKDARERRIYRSSALRAL